MSFTVDVSIAEELMSESPESADDNVPGHLPGPELLQTWASAAYLSDAPSTAANEAFASIRVAGADEIRQLNKQYRDKDKATNVLSFPMQSPEETGVSLLGDIALCAPIIKQEAEQQSKLEDAHWAHMVVHGMLHLQGYDHEEDDEAEDMEQLEIKILKSLGYSDPYQPSDI